MAGAVDGMVATAPMKDGRWQICQIYVRPGMQGTGLGHRLLEAAEQHAVAADATEMVLWTDTRFNQAHRFYERHSYLRAGPNRPLADIGNTLEYRYAKPRYGVRRLDAAGAQSAERVLAAWPGQELEFWQDVTRRVAQGRAQCFAGWCDGVLAAAAWVEDRATRLLVHPEYGNDSLASALREAMRETP